MTLGPHHALMLLALLALVGCARMGPQADASASTAGYTGRTHVIGNNSTVAGDGDATYLQQKWGSSPRR